MDFNTNGAWSEAGEQIFTNAPLAAGTNTLNFPVPSIASATTGTWARFRFSSATNLSFTGEAPDGEVEDYQVAILAAQPPVAPTFTGQAWFGANGFNLTATGGIGQNYVLLSASNLNPPVSWTPLVTNTAAGNGVINFTDTGAGIFPVRFYQLRSP